MISSEVFLKSSDLSFQHLRFRTLFPSPRSQHWYFRTLKCSIGYSFPPQHFLNWKNINLLINFREFQSSKMKPLKQKFCFKCLENSVTEIGNPGPIPLILNHLNCKLSKQLISVERQIFVRLFGGFLPTYCPSFNIAKSNIR